MTDYVQEQLFLAVRDGNDALVGRLIKAGANPNKPAGDSSLLLMAISEQDSKTARALLRGAADPNEAPRGEPPLSAAIKTLSSEPCQSLVKELLAHGADPNGEDEHGVPALQVAIDYGERAVALALMEAGADIEARDCQARTAIIRAVEEDDEDSFQELIRRGANPRVIDDSGRDLLSLARDEQEYFATKFDYPAAVLAAIEARELSAASDPPAAPSSGPSRL